MATTNSPIRNTRKNGLLRRNQLWKACSSPSSCQKRLFSLLFFRYIFIFLKPGIWLIWKYFIEILGEKEEELDFDEEMKEEPEKAESENSRKSSEKEFSARKTPESEIGRKVSTDSSLGQKINYTETN